jgi:hypothetical protein
MSRAVRFWLVGGCPNRELVMFRIPLLTLALASIAAIVEGSGTITFGSSVEHITVNVSGNSGRATFQDRAAGGNVNGQIAINCVQIVGNQATLSGLVTHSNKQSMIGQEGVFRIVDNGNKKDASDMASLINFHEPGIGTDCNAGEFDLTPVKGNFTIR